MKTIYLDNAATTPIHPEVVKTMQESMLSNYGNPSSIHQFGRKAKVVIETSRKKIAKHFNVTASEIIFTAGGTEANNMVLHNAVENLGVKRIVTSKIEHAAVLNVVKALQYKFSIEVVYVKLGKYGEVDLEDLKNILQDDSLKTLVSLMYINNEIGNLLPIKEVSELCKKYKALFHSDTVQAVGHYMLDLKDVPIDFIVASAHKFHGPKGVGFVYCNKVHKMKSFLYGGGQENGRRSGTENVHAILGMEKALTIASESMVKDATYVLSLKKYLVEKLNSGFNNLYFNGFSSDCKMSTYTILNVAFPVKDDLLLLNLDLLGVLVSSGSACASGAQKQSHVLKEVLSEESLHSSFSIRFSFSKMNTFEDVDYLIKILNKLIFI